VLFSEKTEKETYIEMLGTLELKSPVIIKPNWGTSLCFTEAKILDWTIEAVDGKALVVESYGWSRTKDMLFTGKFGSKKRGDLRKSDKWFLEYSGVDKILDKYEIEFLNISEENWAKRTADLDTIKNHVESTYSPVADPDFYSWVPERLYQMRGADFLSLSKLRLGLEEIPASLSIKNLFGMIPTPSRWKYHGKENSLLDTSIIDIYKVYDSLFNIKGVVEAIFTHTDTDIEHDKMKIYRNLGFVAVSKKPLILDAAVMAMCSIDPFQAHIKHAAEVLGGWNPNVTKAIEEQNIVIGRNN
jgi:hypothetical protein